MDTADFLSDNGSIHTSDETRTFGAEIGFVMCNTPPYSPESNGMAESFVKSFKRDYIYLAHLWTAARPCCGGSGRFRDGPRWRCFMGVTCQTVSLFSNSVRVCQHARDNIARRFW
jgi:transposase InsO family protein